ncbi:MAG: tetratricopeptide repeat protein, partial [Bacteroidales bacterium]
IDHEYLVEVQKTGFLTKRIAFNTELPDQVNGRWTMEFAMSLFEGCEGVDHSVLNEPVDRIMYSANKGDFISDEAYVNKIRNRIGNLMMNIERCHTEKFQDLVDEGDVLNRENKLEEARAKYEEALKIFPDDRYVKRKVEEINDRIGVNEQNRQVYGSAVEEADRLYAAQQYEAAREKYSEALQAMPQNNYPREKVAEIDRLIREKNHAEQERINEEKKYNTLVTQGNAAYTAKNFEAAKEYYQQALLVKPGASFPQQRIAELDPAIERQKQQVLAKEANDQAYKEALSMGQKAMQQKNYDLAKQHYSKAVTLKPGESYPQQMIMEADRLIAEQQTAQLKADQAAVEKQIEAALDKGDAMYKAKNYEAAANAYQQALQLDPNDSYARQRYERSKSMLAATEADKQKELERRHLEKVSEGDALVAAASYQQAIAVYKQALLAKPDDAGLQAKLADAEQKLAARQQKRAADEAKKKEYDQLIVKGNGFFSSQQYASAKQAYESALAFFPGQAYPRDKIAEIDGILGRQQQLAEEQKAREQKYNRIILQADNLFRASHLEEAKNAYQQALSIKPEETYPKTRISAIDARIAERNRLEEEQKAKELSYNEAIALADKYYGQDQLKEAKSQYAKALSFKPGENYPSNRIAQINSRLALLEKQRQEKAATEQRYNSAIDRADKAYDKRDYETAKSGYKQALSIRPSESYPRERLNKIAEFERIIAQKEASQKAAVAAAASGSAAAVPPGPSKLATLDFANDSERDKYLNDLKKDYPEGVTLEIHEEKIKVTERYVVYRGEEIREFRRVKFNWGGVEYSLNGKPITQQYFYTQVRAREGEYFKKIKL